MNNTSKLKPFKAACLQMVSGESRDANLATAERLIAKAAAKGATLVLLPENFALMGKAEAEKLAITEQQGAGPVQRFLSEQAKRQRIWLIAGTLPIASEVLERPYARTLVYRPDGSLACHYDKIHLFDVIVEKGKESYCESATTFPGRQPKTVATEMCSIGLSVCYDLRFPELYRQMQQQGAQLFVVPSAFTRRTGEVHWEVLLRARAIENQCYVLAANQAGLHGNKRETYGHSMIIDPWGRVLSALEMGEGIATAEIDLAEVARVRSQFPCLEHRTIR